MIPDWEYVQQNESTNKVHDSDVGTDSSLHSCDDYECLTDELIFTDGGVLLHLRVMGNNMDDDETQQ